MTVFDMTDDEFSRAFVAGDPMVIAEYERLINVYVEKFGRQEPRHFGVSIKQYLLYVKAAIESGEPIDWAKLLYADLPEGAVI